MVPSTKKGDILEDGDADGWVNAPIAQKYLELHPTLAALRHSDGRLMILSSEYSHPAVRPGDQRFLNWINNWLAYHETQGTLRKWCEEWCEGGPPAGGPLGEGGGGMFIPDGPDSSGAPNNRGILVP